MATLIRKTLFRFANYPLPQIIFIIIFLSVSSVGILKNPVMDNLDLIHQGLPVNRYQLIATFSQLIVISALVIYTILRCDTPQIKATNKLVIIYTLFSIGICLCFDYSLSTLFGDSLDVLWITFALLIALSIGRFLFFPLVFLITLISATQFCLQDLYGISLNPTTIADVLGATLNDYLVFTTPQTILLALTAIILSSLLGILIYKWTKKYASKVTFFISITMLIALAISATGRMEGCKYYSRKGIITLLHSVKTAKVIMNSHINTVSKLPSPVERPYSSPLLRGNEGIVFIVHIGESVRADHLSINGYSRKTDPFISSYPNIINFRKCISCAPQTTWATLTILTNGRRTYATNNPICAEMNPTCTTFLDLLNATGFHVFSLMGEPGRNSTWPEPGKYNILLRMYTRKADSKFSTYEESKQIDAISRIIATQNEQNTCLVINNLGSHAPYANYDTDNAPFSPASSKAFFSHPNVNRDVAEQVVNAYDNTIIKNDGYIKQIVSMLKGKPFIYMYISDHGEFLSNNEGWIRTEDYPKYFRYECCEVPFFFLYSASLRDTHPQIYEHLRTLQENSRKRVAQEHVFHTILGLFGIKSEYYRKELDLCSPEAEEYCGPCPDNDGKGTDGLEWY